MHKKVIFLLLFFGLITSPWLYGQNLLTSTYPAAPWSGGDDNDPSGTTNDPTGVACSGGGVETWIDFNSAGGNGSQEGGPAIGAYHQEIITYTFPGALTAGDEYTIYFEYANPGLDECGTIRNGTGRWQFNLNGTFVSGPTIPVGTTGTMEWFKSSVTVTADGSNPAVLTMKPRRAGPGINPYMQIDNIVMVAAVDECDFVNLGSTALNECYDVPIEVCYPICNVDAQAQPGVSNTNPASCDISAGDPTEVLEIPTFDCTIATVVSFDTPILPSNPSVLYHYWGNCAPLSPTMPETIDPTANGYIQQMFCDTDTFGLPAFPGGLSGENGIINFLPQRSEDVGCNGFAEVGSCNCGNTSPDENTAELIQIDFWMAVPELQSQVGFRFSGGQCDAGSFFVGANLNDMCEVAFYTDGTDHDGEVDQFTGTFNINNQLSGECGLLWMRVRLYINDIASRFTVIPQINAGNGWVDIDQLLIEPAVSADDNTLPTVATTTITGYLIDGEFVYEDGGTWDPYGCNAIIGETDTGVCAPLPVDLIRFNALLNEEQVALKWQTASEENNVGFEIQKSSDSRDWEIIGWVKGNGTTANLNNYTYLDKNPFIGENYYRLKQIDYDGQFEFSDIVTVRYEVKNLLIEVSPNPSPGEVNVTVLNPNKEKMKIELYDSSGVLIWKSGTLSDVDIWKKEFNLTQKELYFISVQIGKEVYAKKILIIDKH